MLWGPLGGSNRNDDVLMSIPSRLIAPTFHDKSTTADQADGMCSECEMGLRDYTSHQAMETMEIPSQEHASLRSWQHAMISHGRNSLRFRRCVDVSR